MIAVTFYKAFDGTCFENEDECIKYESDKLKTTAANDYCFLDDELANLACDTIYENLENATYIVVKTSAAAEYIQYIANLDGVAAPKGIGFWAWNGWIGAYEEVGLEEIKKLEGKAIIMRKIYNECQENKERI